jgi:endonuclease/exonuclease/phosphatase (EEP) superfamily protein YafD
MVVVGVDVGANPLRPRGRAFEPLDALLARVKPDLVLGDFNTPRDSVFFEAWRSAGYRHAFEAAGNGTDLTWPMPLPVLSLDHVWSGPRLAPRSCRHVGSWASDHRAVVAEFTGSE